MNFCDLDQGVETLREPFGLFLGRCCRGRALHCPEVPRCCLRGLVPPAVEVPQAPQGSPERRGNALGGGGSESCPCHYLQSH